MTDIIKILIALVASSIIISLVFLLIEKVMFNESAIDLIKNPLEANLVFTSVVIFWTLFWIIITTLISLTTLILSIL